MPKMTRRQIIQDLGSHYSLGLARLPSWDVMSMEKGPLRDLREIVEATLSTTVSVEEVPGEGVTGSFATAKDAFDEEVRTTHNQWKGFLETLDRLEKDPNIQKEHPQLLETALARRSEIETALKTKMVMNLKNLGEDVSMPPIAKVGDEIYLLEQDGVGTAIKKATIAEVAYSSFGTNFRNPSGHDFHAHYKYLFPGQVMEDVEPVDHGSNQQTLMSGMEKEQTAFAHQEWKFNGMKVGSWPQAFLTQEEAEKAANDVREAMLKKLDGVRSQLTNK